ncbi:hypothetical protein FGADI_5726 [Fusarium gaditjirri]|uniref:Uncharacterized protein n=1 Tax=Fusarium gaditjirri TaxID=282569 RepID=A0A8H4WWT5_9HYPO|nr:hypothetical protein FGADI_5726 [Fusarium gaditjirri]
MPWVTTEDNTRLRARQLRRFYDKHNSSEGPLQYGDKILQTDIDLATTLAPDYSLENCAQGEEEYPEQWVTKPKSLSYTLSNFRLKAKEMTDTMDREIEAAMNEDVTTSPPVFIGGNGDKSHIRFLVLLTDRLKQLLQEAKEETKAAEQEAEQYLTRAEKAEARLKNLLEELEEEDDEDEEGDEDKENEEYEEDRSRKRRKSDGASNEEDDEDGSRKRRKIDGTSNGVQDTIHCSMYARC